MYVKFEVSMICILKVIDITMIEQIRLPNEKFTSNNLHFLSYALL